MEINIGIDLGTTNTVVCYSRRGRPDYLDFGNSTLLPSAVYVKEDNKTLVGDAALKMGNLNPKRLIRSSKTHMGDIDFVYPDSEPRLSFEKKFTPTDIAEIILREVKQTLIDEEICEEDDTINAVITVPAYFSIKQIAETTKAGEKAGFKIKRILSEPTAAAIAYVRKQIKDKTRIFVVDFGGGTFDIALLQYDKNSPNKYDLVKEPGGDNHLGGDNIDDALVEWIMKRVEDDCGVDLSNIKKSNLSEEEYFKAVSKIYNHAKATKHQLSEKIECQIDIPELLQGYTFSTTVTREQFDKCCESIYQKMVNTIADYINEQNIDITKLDEIILVGGSCYIPRVRKITEEIFHKKAIPIDLSNVVANGAYITASEGLNPVEKTAFDLGIEVLKKDSFSETKFVPIISRGSVVPCSFDKAFSPASDGQKEIKVNVYERSAKIPFNDESVDNCNFIGSIYFNDFLPGDVSNTKINVKFEFDKSRVLTIRLTDVNTGSTSSSRKKILSKLENKRYKITKEDVSSGPMDIFLLVDASGSMSGSRINSVRKAVKSLVNDMVDMSVSRVGIISFQNSHELVCDLTSDKNLIINKTMKIITGGGTCPSSAFNEAYKKLHAATSGRKKAVIMLTDGEIFSIDKTATENICSTIRNDGIRLITIGAGYDTNSDYLRKLASNNGKGKDMYPIAHMEQLAATFRTIINSLRET